MPIMLNDVQVYRILGTVWDRALNDAVEYGESSQAMWEAACDGGAPDAVRYYECQSEVYDDLAARMRAAACYVEDLVDQQFPTVDPIDPEEAYRVSQVEANIAYWDAYDEQLASEGRCNDCGMEHASCFCPF